ncbi:MAG: dethiobiotin synthase [Campylobacterales bacterium]
MDSIFITATNTEVGKTTIAKALIDEYGKKGIKVTPFKPIETGVVDEPEDALVLLECAKKYNLNLKNLTPKDITAYTFSLPAAPYVAKDMEIDMEVIKKKKEALLGYGELLLIEGAGGLMVPIYKDYFMIDLIDELGATPFLVSTSKLGCINDLLLSLGVLESRFGSVLFGLNLFDESYFSISHPYLSEHFKKLFLLPKDIKEVADELLKRVSSAK